jgi:hypothetical protein
MTIRGQGLIGTEIDSGEADHPLSFPSTDMAY